MRNLIPRFIADKYIQKEYLGNFSAITMFLDISGFTIVTERLMQEGKEGAEVLSSIINNIFEPVIEKVYSSDGFISTFAGDAFTAIFPDLGNPLQIANCAIEINQIFQEIGKQQTKYGEFELFVKLGLSAGNVEWGIIGGDSHQSYYFRGEAIDGCADSEHHCEKTAIVIDQRFLQLLPKGQIEVIAIGLEYFKLINGTGLYQKPKRQIIEPISEEILHKFIPDQVLNLAQQGEFREIVSVFISFKELDDNSKLSISVNEIIKHCIKQGGYFNKIDFGDKGGVILVLFGAPVSYENNIVRALNFIYHLKTAFNGNIRAGLTFGVAYTGFVGSSQRSEYTALGDVINLASHFIMTADFGEVWISEKIKDKVNNLYSADYLGIKLFKGKAEPITVFKLLQKEKRLENTFFEGEMVGRESEIDQLNENHQLIKQGKFAGITTIYADAGMGKSRLAYEFTQKLPNVQILIMETDSILKMSLNPFKYMLNNYFKQPQANSKAEKYITFETVYNQLLTDLNNSSDHRKLASIKQLERFKTILAYQIDIDYENSLYQQLDPKGRYENTIIAYKEFFFALCICRPVVILIEDIHWLDDDSHKVFKTLCRYVGDYPLMIVATSRFNDDGSKPVLKVDNSVIQKEIVLDKLAPESAQLFIESQLDSKVDSELLEFVNNRAEYNPFYIEQIIFYLKENDLLVSDNGVIHLKTLTFTIPDSVKAVIIARIDRLGKELKSVVQLASVLGREVELKVFTAMLELYQSVINKDDVEPLLKEIDKEQLWTKFSELKYIFKHALLQEAVYDMQLKSRLRELHLLAAISIERIYFGDAEKYNEIAWHYDRAEKISDAITNYEKAGEFFIRTYSNQKAFECYDHLLELVSDDDIDKKIDYMLKKSDIMEHIGQWKECEDIREETLNLAIRSGIKEKIAQANQEYGSILSRKGDYQKAMSCYDMAMKIFVELGKNNQIAETLMLQGWICILKSEDAVARSFYEQAMAIYKELDCQKGIASAEMGMAIILSNLGDNDAAMEAYQRCLQIEEKIGTKLRVAILYNNMAGIYADKKDHQSAMKCFELYLNVSEEIGNTKGISIANGNIGETYFDLGDYDNALICYEKKLKIDEELQDRYGIAWVLYNFGRLYEKKGDISKALEYYRRTLSIEEELGNKQTIAKLTKFIDKLAAK